MARIASRSDSRNIRVLSEGQEYAPATFKPKSCYIFGMRKNSHHSVTWGGLLLLLILANLVIHWPRKTHSKVNAAGAPHGVQRAPDNPPAEIKAQLEAAVQNLPEDQRAAVTQRMSEDRAFFDSVKDLPEQERQQKTQEHFVQNPPPQIPGMPSPSDSERGPGNDHGTPVSGEGPQSGHIPSPEVRYGMDQQIANAQKSTATP
jgi:hypothetical protein